MHVLLINASIKKRKSRSLRIAHSFIKGLEENINISKHIRVTEICLYEKTIQNCKCCYSCWNDIHASKCIINDDMQGLLDLYADADLVVWSFPLLFYSFPAEMKKFIERTFSLYIPNEKFDGQGYAHQPRYKKMKERREVFISTCGFALKENNYEPVYEMIRILYQGRADKIFCTQGMIFEDDRFAKIVSRYLKCAKEAGRSYSPLDGIEEKYHRRLNQQIVAHELYAHESNSNREWLQRANKS